MNQGKLDVVKQAMASVNINILGVSEVKWMGMGEFNSVDHWTWSTLHMGLLSHKSPSEAME